MLGITIVPKNSQIPSHGEPVPYRVAGSYRELLSIIIDLVNRQGVPQENDIMLIRGSDKSEWTKIPDDNKEVQNLKSELRSCRYRMQELIEKAWELGGQYVGGEEFEEYDFVKDSREQINSIDKILEV